jgi:hypothetical protein
MEWLEPANEKPISSSQQRYAGVDTILNIFLRKLRGRLRGCNKYNAFERNGLCRILLPFFDFSRGLIMGLAVRIL